MRRAAAAACSRGAARFLRGSAEAARPGPVLAGGPRPFDVEALAAPPQRDRAAAARDLAVDRRAPGSRPAVSRLVTTTAARAQSSAKASGRITCETSLPSGRAADAAQRRRSGTLSPRLLSLGSRASPSAASHSLAVKASRPLRWIASRPSAPRTASAAPSDDTSTSGSGVADRPQAAATTISTPPHQRSGVFSRQSTTSPAVTSSSGPAPNAAIRPTAPGSCATNSATCDHPVDARAHQPPEHAVEAERDGEQAQQAHRHHPDRDDRHGEQVGDHAVGRQPMKMEGCVRRCRQTRNQRRKNERDDLAAAPQRHPGADRGVGAGRHPGQAALVGGDQRKRRRKRHLEARMHHRLRGQQQHAERRERQRPQRQRRPVDHHADQHDRRS